MPLRCLLFSSDEGLVQPIWQALADLGIEGEYCKSAVDAVERVTTQLFQIVITDWEDQPEAAFLLKTARDLKAANRPLTLAIVKDDAGRPAALQAGANSILLKPIRAEQVRDTMSTACELLRAKMQPAAQKTTAPAPQKAPQPAAFAAAAAAAVSVPVSVTKMPEAFRAGEFLQAPGAAPGAQFDTECDVQKSLDQVAAAEVDALTELEPTAAAVESTAPAEPEPEQPLTGWAALQARLTKNAPPAAKDVSPKNELLSYEETPSYGTAPAKSGTENDKDKEPATKESQENTEPEAALFAYMAGEQHESVQPTEQSPPKRSAVLLMSALAAIFLILLAVPQTRRSLGMICLNVVHTGGVWLNPPPAPLPQAAAQHDSFGQSGDEYSLPTAGTIPDATTDPSQIRVVPVIDPTAKPDKNAGANGGQSQAATSGNNAAAPNLTGQSQNGEPQAGASEVKEQTPPAASDSSMNAAGTSSTLPPSAPVQQVAPVVEAVAPQLRPATATTMPSPVRPPAVSTANSAGIPSSLKSQIASMTPESSGAKPVEAAMSSIEPVNLPESAARGLLAQVVEPDYPAAAKASGQRGSVVLQVIIGRDGTVQDAKFLQGSLVFARAAIDAVKQWSFKPYLMNGRAVSVQSVITLNFKPAA